MSEGFIVRGFHSRRKPGDERGDSRRDNIWSAVFALLSAGPMPLTPLTNWDFTIVGEVDQPKRWSWEEFHALPRETVTKDIHCVTKWSKFDTHWEGVSLDTLLAQVTTAARYVIAFSDGAKPPILLWTRCCMGRPGWSTPTKDNPCHQNMAVRHACWPRRRRA